VFLKGAFDGFCNAADPYQSGLNAVRSAGSQYIFDAVVVQSFVEAVQKAPGQDADFITEHRDDLFCFLSVPALPFNTASNSHYSYPAPASSSSSNSYHLGAAPSYSSVQYPAPSNPSSSTDSFAQSLSAPAPASAFAFGSNSSALTTSDVDIPPFVGTQVIPFCSPSSGPASNASTHSRNVALPLHMNVKRTSAPKLKVRPLKVNKKPSAKKPKKSAQSPYPPKIATIVADIEQSDCLLLWWRRHPIFGRQ